MDITLYEDNAGGLYIYRVGDEHAISMGQDPTRGNAIADMATLIDWEDDATTDRVPACEMDAHRCIAILGMDTGRFDANLRAAGAAGQLYIIGQILSV